jgi:xanthine dehydrogenase accessory factor
MFNFPKAADLTSADGVDIAPRRLVVFGGGELAAALDAQCALLGWESESVDSIPRAVELVAELGAGDGVLVMDHSGEADAPVLGGALKAGIGYVSALGSRATQQARSERLQDAGYAADLIAELRGPAGLDIGARTAAEVALAIVAEMLSARTGKAAIQPLRDLSGPINRPAPSPGEYTPRG